MTFDSFNEKLDHIPPSGIRSFFDLVMSMDDVISLGVGEPDFDTPWSIRDDAIYSLEQGLTSYTSNQGLLSLRQAISADISRKYGPSYDPELEVLVTVGVSEAVDVTVRALLNPGDHVIIPEPAYVCYTPLVQLTGATVTPIDTQPTGFVPTIDQIKAAITPKTKLIILCSPSNPTGMVIPRSTLQSIAQLANDHGIWVMSDEIYADLHYDDSFSSYVSIPNTRAHTIYLGGFSKAHAMTGWRIGYMCAPHALIERALKIHQYSILCAPILSQYAALEALKSAGPAVEAMRQSYQRRRQLFVDGLNRIGLPTAMPQGAFYCFVDIRSTGLTSEQFAVQLLESQRVAVVPGPVFGLGGEGFVRCCFATDLDQLKLALERMDAFCQSLLV